MIAGKLADFAGKRDGAVGQEDFRLADAARIKNDLARRRIAGVVLVSQPEIIVAKRDPATFAAPAHMDDLLPIGQQRNESRDGGRRLLLGLRFEFIGPCGDANFGHDPILSKKSVGRAEQSEAHAVFLEAVHVGTALRALALPTATAVTPMLIMFQSCPKNSRERERRYRYPRAKRIRPDCGSRRRGSGQTAWRRG